MTREEKKQAIDKLSVLLAESKNVYLADISGMDADQTSKLRRLCFSKGVELQLVKNTLLRKAMESCDKDYDELYDVLKGNTSMMLSDTANAPAKAITEFLKKNKNTEKPLFKGAFVEESVYSADQLAILEQLKSKEELIGDIITLLQSPAKNVISGLQSGGNTLAGLMKTLEERAQ
ncbi:MAG: 50S ribosomal protein L10 [Flavobacteriales bacterium]|nr:50S ribosomal protein L10 [Flavobacteriales bacterium]